MEISIQINKKNEYHGKLLHSYIGKTLSKSSHNILQKLIDQGYTSIDAICIGAGWCDNLLLTPEQYKEWYELAQKEHLKLIIQIPIITEKNIPRFENLLITISSLNTNIELIINDIGAIYLLKKYNLPVSAGKYLDHSLFDPRVSNDEYNQYFNDDGIKFANGKSVYAQYFNQVFKKFNVIRVELDDLITITPAQARITILSVPFTYVATGRRCFFKYNKNCKCNKECLSIIQENYTFNRYITMDGTLKKKLIPFIRKGNTLMYENYINLDNLPQDLYRINIDMT